MEENKEVQEGRVTRRNFLKGGAAVGVAVAAGAALAGCGGKSRSDDSKGNGGSGSAAGSGADVSNIKWDREVDMVILGSGSGMGAGIVAQQEGLETIILEKGNFVGGSLIYSGGAVWIPNNKWSQAKGDSYEKSETYLKHMQHHLIDDETAQELMYAFLDNGQKVVDDLNAAGIGLTEYLMDGYTGYEYHANWEGAQNEGGRTLGVVAEDGTMGYPQSGKALGDALRKAYEDGGGEILTETPGKWLITRPGEGMAPEVIGVVAEDKRGDQINIKARKGVLIATGGFEWDERLNKTYLHNPCRYFVSFKTQTGDGLKMAQAVGADLHMMNWYWGHCFYTSDGEYGKEQGRPAALLYTLERMQPGSIMVDATGRRFQSEWSDYDSGAHAFGFFNNGRGQGFAMDPAWQVFDNDCYETFHPGEHGEFVAGKSYEDYSYTANTIEELAEKIGVQPEILRDTVEQWNKYAAEGRDPLFDRVEIPIMGTKEVVTYENRPLGSGPYHAVSCSPGCFSSVGGPLVDKNAQVTHVSGEKIKGLYACGNCAGIGSPGPSYGGAGGTIGPALVFGDLAAHHIAQQDSWQ